VTAAAMHADDDSDERWPDTRQHGTVNIIFNIVNMAMTREQMHGEMIA
jgi:hypothetical protein